MNLTFCGEHSEAIKPYNSLYPSASEPRKQLYSEKIREEKGDDEASYWAMCIRKRFIVKVIITQRALVRAG